MEVGGGGGGKHLSHKVGGSRDKVSLENFEKKNPRHVYLEMPTHSVYTEIPKLNQIENRTNSKQQSFKVFINDEKHTIL